MPETPAAATIEALAAQLRRFNAERDWEQFHAPKNLVMALAGELGELAEIFQWLTPEQSRLAPSSPRFAQAEEEVADVFIYLVQLADELGIDLMAAALKKVARNEAKYPVHLARGQAAKYTELAELAEPTAPTAPAGRIAPAAPAAPGR
jgi:NTP pyrophosphatase (non-canonical NTP hydrolase)